MMNLGYWGFLMFAFAAGATLVFGVYLAWEAYLEPKGKAMSKRLQALLGHEQALEEIQLVKRRFSSHGSNLENWLMRLPGIPALDGLLVQSGVSITLTQCLGWGLMFIAAAAFAPLLLGLPPLLSLLCVMAIPLIAILFFNYRRSQRLQLIEQQLPDALDLIGRSMQAGHTFTSALLIAATEGRPPVSAELRTVFDEMNFGVDLKESMQNLSTRVPTEDVRFFVVAVLIQSETGGKLVDILKNTATLIRERQKIAVVVRVLSAEGTISATMLSVMPFAVAGALSLINPGFISILWTDPLGVKIAITALCMMIIGIFWMWRLVKIRV